MVTLSCCRGLSTVLGDSGDAHGERVKVGQQKDREVDQLLNLLGGPVLVFMDFDISFRAHGVSELDESSRKHLQFFELFDAILQSTAPGRILVSHSALESLAKVVDRRRKHPRVSRFETFQERARNVFWHELRHIVIGWRRNSCRNPHRTETLRPQVAAGGGRKGITTVAKKCVDRLLPSRARLNNEHGWYRTDWAECRDIRGPAIRMKPPCGGRERGLARPARQLWAIILEASHAPS